MQPGKALELHAACVWSSNRQYGFHVYASPEAGLDYKHSIKDWIPGQVTTPNRYALRRGPRQPGMTQYIAWRTCFGTFPHFHLQISYRSSYSRSIITSSRYHLTTSSRRPPSPFHQSTDFTRECQINITPIRAIPRQSAPFIRADLREPLDPGFPGNRSISYFMYVTLLLSRTLQLLTSLSIYTPVARF